MARMRFHLELSKRPITSFTEIRAPNIVLFRFWFMFRNWGKRRSVGGVCDDGIGGIGRGSSSRNRSYDYAMVIDFPRGHCGFEIFGSSTCSASGEEANQRFVTVFLIWYREGGRSSSRS